MAGAPPSPFNTKLRIVALGPHRGCDQVHRQNHVAGVVADLQPLYAALGHAEGKTGVGRHAGANEEAGRARAGDDAVDGLDDGGMLDFADQAERGREVPGAERDRVEAGDGENVIEGGHGVGVFDLDRDEDLAVGALDEGVTADASVVGGHARPVAALAQRRVAAAVDDILYFGGGADLRHDNAVGAGVEHRFDEGCCAAGHAHERRPVSRLGGQQMSAQRLQGHRAVLHVDPEEVDRIAERVGGVWVGQRDRGADADVAGGHSGAEGSNRSGLCVVGHGQPAFGVMVWLRAAAARRATEVFTNFQKKTN